MLLGKARLLLFYLYGYALVFGQAVIAAVLSVWGMQVIAMLLGKAVAWGPVLHHLILSLTFLAFFPGQQIWTFRMRGPDDRFYTIVGTELDDDKMRAP